jgi:hypothetical protein
MVSFATATAGLQGIAHTNILSFSAIQQSTIFVLYNMLQLEVSEGVTDTKNKGKVVAQIIGSSEPYPFGIILYCGVS